MVSCKHCSTPNSLDSTFCKHCGTALPEEGVLLAQEKLTALIGDGNTAFSEGRTDEAMAVAESALLSNPSSVGALALKTLCHERRGELAEALECADKIVELNPDSELDKIKRNQLRVKLSTTAQLATAPPDRRTALVGAIAAVVLMVCIGVAAAKYQNNAAAVKASSEFVKNDSATKSSQPSGQPTDTGASKPNQIQPNNPGTGGTPMNGGPGYAQPGPTYPNYSDRQANPDRLNTPLDPGGEITIGTAGTGPIGTSGQSRQNKGPDTGNVKAPTATQSQDRTATSDDPPPKAEDAKNVVPEPPPVVDIQISSGTGGGKKSFGGSVDTGGASGATALDKIGIQRYELGSYGAAAASFEKALQAGGDAVSINQWLGRCYGKLGKKTDAIGAYQRAAAACQTALSGGTGNKDRLRATLDTCQQAIKVLQGN